MIVLVHLSTRRRAFVQVSGLGTFQVHTTLRRTTTATTVSTVPMCRMFVRYCLTNYQVQKPAVPFNGRCEVSEATSPAWTECGLAYPNISTVSMPFTIRWPVCNAAEYWCILEFRFLLHDFDLLNPQQILQQAACCRICCGLKQPSSAAYLTTYETGINCRYRIERETTTFYCSLLIFFLCAVYILVYYPFSKYLSIT